MMNRHLLSFLAFLLLFSCNPAIIEDGDLLLQLMQKEPSKFGYILEHSGSLEVQLMYTQINWDANNLPEFKSFYFQTDSTHYFYPASTVKLPLVLMAMEKLNDLKINGLDKFTPA